MKLGADPEFFVLNETGSFINAYKVLPHTKNKPLKFNNNSKLFCDNVLIEFNVEPANTCEEFVRNCIFARDFAKQKVGNKRLSLHAYAEFDSDELKSKNAKEYGCSPEFDAYTLCQNGPPTSLFKDSICRVAGGHIHIGGNKTEIICNPIYKPLFAFMLDLFVAIPSVLIDNSAESYRRREYFGKSGTYRDKEYGLEYRVLSPFWLRSESTIGLMYLLCNFVYNEMNENLYKKFYNIMPEMLKSPNPKSAYECFGYDEVSLQRAINTNNYSLARRFFNFACNFMPNKIIELVEHEINSPKSLLL
jgi:hypothetical protein